MNDFQIGVLTGVLGMVLLGVVGYMFTVIVSWLNGGGEG